MVKIGSARLDENGRIAGGKAGDQGNEVSTQNWYLHPQGWIVLRPVNKEQAEKIARTCEDICSNPNVGYDQNQRGTLYKAAEAVKWDCKKITTPCETDCSAMVRVECAAAGIFVGDFNTANEAKVLVASGAFKKLTAKKYTESQDYLERGDVLVTKTQGHTVTVLTTGQKATTKKSIDEIANEVIAGKWSTGSERRRLLEAAGYVYAEVQTAVNAKLKEQEKKSISEIADEVIEGKWGNGSERKKRLEAAGYNYGEVQAEVNRKTAAKPVYYVIQSGDTLSKIAQKFGTTVAALSALNGITNPNRITAGHRIRVK